MIKKTHRIPDFKTDAKAAAFWDSHDSTKYISQTKPAYLKFPKPRHKVVVDLGERQWKALQRLAHREKISFTHLLQKLISEELTTANR